MVDGKNFKNLFIVSYGALGDFCMTLFFLDQAHRGRPHARFFVLATRNAKLLQEMSAKYPFVEIVPLVSFRMLAVWVGSIGRSSLCVLPPTFYPVPAAISFVLFALSKPNGWIAGFTSRALHPRYDTVVPFEANKLLYENFDALLARLKLPHDGQPRLSFVEDQSVLQSLNAKRFIVLAPFASNPGKTLSMERWATLLHFLSEQYPAYAIVLIGGPDDVLAAQELARVGTHPHRAIFCGAPFAQTAALIAHAALVIGSDSGLIHVAGMLRAPTVSVNNLRSLTSLPRYNPHATILTQSAHCQCRGDKTGDCYYEIAGVRYLRCMWDVSDERIEAAVAEKLDTLSI